MHADELVGALGGRGNGGDGDGRSVGGQDGLGLAQAVQLGKDVLLDLQVLDGGLNHQVGVRSGGQIGGEAHVSQDVGLLGLVHLALGNQLLQPLVQAGLGSLDDGVVDVAHHHVIAAAGKHLGNVQTHGAAANDNNLFHRNFSPYLF